MTGPATARRAALLLLVLLAAPAHGEPPAEVPGAVTARPRIVGPLSREDAVQVALARGLRIAMAREEAVMAAAETLAAASELRPRLSATVLGAVADRGMVYATAPGIMPVFYAVLPDRNVASLNLMAMVPLFTGGRLETMLRNARAQEQAALARTAWELVDVARGARVAYAEAQLARDQLDIALWRVTESEENLRLAEQRLKAGRVARYVVLRARAELAEARQGANDARADQQVREADLKAALSVDMTSELEVIDPPATPPATTMDPKDALARRPDLVAARHGIQAAEQAVLAARARYSPQVYGTAMGEGMYRGPRDADAGYSVGLTASLPILDGGERRAGVQRAQAEERLRRLRLEELELEVTRQGAQASARLLAAVANVDLAREQVEQAREDLRVARLRFAVGRAIQLEVLDALEALARARFNYSKALYAANVARADVLWAAGLTREP